MQSPADAKPAQASLAAKAWTNAASRRRTGFDRSLRRSQVEPKALLRRSLHVNRGLVFDGFDEGRVHPRQRHPPSGDIKISLDSRRVEGAAVVKHRSPTDNDGYTKAMATGGPDSGPWQLLGPAPDEPLPKVRAQVMLERLRRHDRIGGLNFEYDLVAA